MVESFIVRLDFLNMISNNNGLIRQYLSIGINFKKIENIKLNPRH